MSPYSARVSSPFYYLPIQLSKEESLLYRRKKFKIIVERFNERFNTLFVARAKESNGPVDRVDIA